jgi:hypothetical protein
MQEGILNQAKSATIACTFRGEEFSHSLRGFWNTQDYGTKAIHSRFITM